MQTHCRQRGEGVKKGQKTAYALLECPLIAFRYMLSSMQTPRLQNSFMAIKNLLVDPSIFVRIEWTQIASCMYVSYLKMFDRKYSFDLVVS